MSHTATQPTVAAPAAETVQDADPISDGFRRLPRASVKALHDLQGDLDDAEALVRAALTLVAKHIEDLSITDTDGYQFASMLRSTLASAAGDLHELGNRLCDLVPALPDEDGSRVKPADPAPTATARGTILTHKQAAWLLWTIRQWHRRIDSDGEHVRGVVGLLVTAMDEMDDAEVSSTHVSPAWSIARAAAADLEKLYLEDMEQAEGFLVGRCGDIEVPACGQIEITDMPESLKAVPWDRGER